MATSLAPNQQTQIEILDPCLSPHSISAPPQVSPEDYYYTKGGTTFTASSLIVYPPVCPVTYECLSTEILQGSDADIRCDDPEIVTFDPASGHFVFETADMEKYSPGQYQFNMRGTVGVQDKISADYSISLKLVNPCPLTSLRNVLGTSFMDMRYTLGRDAVNQPFIVSDFVEVDTRVDCGQIKLEFIDEQGDPLDENVFAVRQKDDQAELTDKVHNFIVKKQSNSRTVGRYQIRYRATLEDYPSVRPVTLESPFQVDIIGFKESDYVFNVVPDWLTQLEDQYVVLGDHLVYSFGEKTSMFGDEVQVKVHFGRTAGFADYEADLNSYNVNGDRTRVEDIGLHKIKVEVTYLDPRGREQYFSNFFYLHVTERPNEDGDSDPEPEEVNTEPLIVTESNFAGYWKPQEKRDDRPRPYIAAYSQTGLMTIGWDRTMQPAEEPKEIPITRVPVRVDQLPPEDETDGHSVIGRGGRRLAGEIEQPIWFRDSEKDRLIRVALLDALQVRLKMDEDSDEDALVENFAWDIEGYSPDFVWLRIKFDNPQDIGAFDSKDIIEVTFWGIEFFKSFQGIEVEFGTKLYWRIQR